MLQGLLAELLSESFQWGNLQTQDSRDWDPSATLQDKHAGAACSNGLTERQYAAPAQQLKGMLQQCPNWLSEVR